MLGEEVLAATVYVVVVGSSSPSSRAAAATASVSAARVIGRADAVEGAGAPLLGAVDDPGGEVAHVDHLHRVVRLAGQQHLGCPAVSASRAGQ